MRLSTGGGGDGGIRTLDTPLQAYNGLANRRLQPLGHVSSGGALIEAGWPDCKPREPRIEGVVTVGLDAYRRAPHRLLSQWGNKAKNRPNPAGWLACTRGISFSRRWRRSWRWRPAPWRRSSASRAPPPRRAIAASSAARRRRRHAPRAANSCASPSWPKPAAMQAAAPPAARRPPAPAKRAR